MNIISKRSLNLRFALALGFMAFLSVASFLVAANIFHASDVSSEAVNLSGRQRMLTARIVASYLGKLLAPGESGIELASTRLKEATTELAQLRDFFRQGAPDKGIPSPNQGALRKLYFESPDKLAERLDAFLDNANKAQGMNREALIQDQALLAHMLTADTRIIPILDKSVEIYAAINDATAKNLLLLEFTATILSLCMLAGIGLFIFRPMREAIMRDREKLFEMNALLERLASTDPLTGTNNRLKFKEVFADMAARSLRYQEPVSCIMLDIDHFKKINDLCGHPVGDAVLRELAGLLRANLRQTDHLFRWGGEEFLILLPHTEIEEAALAAEKLRAAVKEKDFGCQLPVTISLGLSRLLPCEAEESLTMRADKALYEAKRTGRNRVCLASDEDPECRFNLDLPPIK